MPFRWFYFAIEVADHDSPDGSPAAYMVEGAVSGAAEVILPRDYSASFRQGEVGFALDGTDMRARAPLADGAGEIRMSGRRHVPQQPATLSGLQTFIGPDGNGGHRAFPVGFSFSFALLEDFRLDFDLPKGHPLECLRDLRPDWGIEIWDKSASLGVPEPLGEAYGDAGTRIAFLDTLGRIGRAMAIVERNGRVVYLTAEAATLLEGEDAALRRLPPPLVSGAMAATGPVFQRPALLDLPSGRQLLARAFPIALRLGTGPLAMVVLTDPRAPSPTDPEPLLRLMGLTGAEAALAALVGLGRSPAEAAGLRGITPSTARSTLKAVFQKLGLRRQAELAVLVTRLQSA